MLILTIPGGVFLIFFGKKWANELEFLALNIHYGNFFNSKLMKKLMLWNTTIIGVNIIANIPLMIYYNGKAQISIFMMFRMLYFGVFLALGALSLT